MSGKISRQDTPFRLFVIGILLVILALTVGLIISCCCKKKPGDYRGDVVPIKCDQEEGAMVGYTRKAGACQLLAVNVGTAEARVFECANNAPVTSFEDPVTCDVAVDAGVTLGCANHLDTRVFERCFVPCEGGHVFYAVNDKLRCPTG